MLKLYIHVCVCVHVFEIMLLTLTNTINDIPTSVMTDPLQNEYG